MGAPPMHNFVYYWNCNFHRCCH